MMSDVNTYVEEMVVKFITGQEPVSNLGAFQSRLQQMGIERAIEIKQAGMERYTPADDRLPLPPASLGRTASC